MFPLPIDRGGAVIEFPKVETYGEFNTLLIWFRLTPDKHDDLAWDVALLTESAVRTFEAPLEELDCLPLHELPFLAPCFFLLLHELFFFEEFSTSDNEKSSSSTGDGSSNIMKFIWVNN